MKTNSVLVSEVVNVMNNITGCQFCSLSYSTDTDHINKKLAGGRSNPYYGRVSSVTDIIGCQFNASYENAVNNRLPKGDGKGEKFVAESLPWGEWLVPNKTISHKGSYYLRLYTTKATKKETTYILDGVKVADKNTIKAIEAAFRPSSSSNRQAAAGIEEKDQVKPFTLCIDSVNQISIDGKKMVIIH